MTVSAQWLSILMVILEYFGMRQKEVVPLGAALLYIVVVGMFCFFRGDLKRRMIDKAVDGEELAMEG